MRVLIVVDMQNDFIDGALGSREAVAIVPHVADKIRAYQETNDLIIFTRDTHGENYLETQEGRKLPVPHCIRNTTGWEISSKLPTEGCPIIDKITFGAKDLPQLLADCLACRGVAEPASIELVGLCTDICVISNAMVLKAYFPEVPILVDSSCCAGVTPTSHETALNAMKMCQIEIN